MWPCHHQVQACYHQPRHCRGGTPLSLTGDKQATEPCERRGLARRSSFSEVRKSERNIVGWIRLERNKSVSLFGSGWDCRYPEKQRFWSHLLTLHSPSQQSQISGWFDRGWPWNADVGHPSALSSLVAITVVQLAFSRLGYRFSLYKFQCLSLRWLFFLCAVFLPQNNSYYVADLL